MARILLVRHGQTNGFLTDGYTDLTPTGVAQARALGTWLRARGEVPTAVVVGPQPRHEQTWRHAAEAAGGWPDPVRDPGLDEHDGARAVLEGAQQGLLDPAQLQGAVEAFEASEGRRAALRLFRGAMERWVAGSLDVPGAEPWPVFRARVGAALDRLAARGVPGGTVLAFTSGGVVGAAVATVLGLPSEAGALDLSFEVANASLTELRVSGRRRGLHAFNLAAHLGDAVPWTAV
ncbi:MAG: histidine phosphatase family protein [Alphaproteobacteria bacterium]|nr:histidine phosphatase family protein [Alphaproteobacteria bacterium]